MSRSSRRPGGRAAFLEHQAKGLSGETLFTPCELALDCLAVDRGAAARCFPEVARALDALGRSTEKSSYGRLAQDLEAAAKDPSLLTDELVARLDQFAKDASTETLREPSATEVTELAEARAMVQEGRVLEYFEEQRFRLVPGVVEALLIDFTAREALLPHLPPEERPRHERELADIRSRLLHHVLHQQRKACRATTGAPTLACP